MVNNHTIHKLRHLFKRFAPGLVALAGYQRSYLKYQKTKEDSVSDLEEMGEALDAREWREPINPRRTGSHLR